MRAHWGSGIQNTDSCLKPVLHHSSSTHLTTVFLPQRKRRCTSVRGATPGRLSGLSFFAGRKCPVFLTLYGADACSALHSSKDKPSFNLFDACAGWLKDASDHIFLRVLTTPPNVEESTPNKRIISFCVKAARPKCFNHLLIGENKKLLH